MTKNPRGYPDEIELKVEDRVGSYSDENTFNTEDQQEVGHDLVNEWPIQFQDLADGENYSRQMVPNVLESYFGPVDDDITFEEIEEEYGGYDQYMSRRRNAIGEVDLPDDVELNKRELDIAIKMMQDGFEEGYDKGYDKGYNRGYQDGANDRQQEQGN